VWSDFVVVDSPVFDDLLGLVDGLEPVFVQTFISESSVEGFDITVLLRFSGLDEGVFNLVTVAPLIQGNTGKLRSIIGVDTLRFASEFYEVVEYPADSMSADRAVQFDPKTLTSVIVDYGEHA